MIVALLLVVLLPVTPRPGGDPSGESDPGHVVGEPDSARLRAAVEALARGHLRPGETTGETGFDHAASRRDELLGPELTGRTRVIFEALGSWIRRRGHPTSVRGSQLFHGAVNLLCHIATDLRTLVELRLEIDRLSPDPNSIFNQIQSRRAEGKQNLRILREQAEEFLGKLEPVGARDPATMDLLEGSLAAHLGLPDWSESLRTLGIRLRATDWNPVDSDLIMAHQALLQADWDDLPRYDTLRIEEASHAVGVAARQGPSQLHARDQIMGAYVLIFHRLCLDHAKLVEHAQDAATDEALDYLAALQAAGRQQVVRRLVTEMTSFRTPPGNRELLEGRERWPGYLKKIDALAAAVGASH